MDGVGSRCTKRCPCARRRDHDGEGNVALFPEGAVAEGEAGAHGELRSQARRGPHALPAAVQKTRGDGVAVSCAARRF